MPHALEFPGMLGAVIPLVSGEGRSFGVVGELVALPLGHTIRSLLFAGRRTRLVPGLTAIVRPLNDLPEPTAGLGRVNAIGVGERSFQVIHLPSGEMRAANVPFFALAV